MYWDQQEGAAAGHELPDLRSSPVWRHTRGAELLPPLPGALATSTLRPKGTAQGLASRVRGFSDYMESVLTSREKYCIYNQIDLAGSLYFIYIPGENMCLKCDQYSSIPSYAAFVLDISMMKCAITHRVADNP